MKNKKIDCCNNQLDKKLKKKSAIYAILSGIFPHTFCILFIVFTVLGMTSMTYLLKPIMMSQYFFYILILVSIIFTTISALIYLKTTNNLSIKGIIIKQKYLLMLYLATISINILLFLIIFPLAANLGVSVAKESDSNIMLQVAIPCSGHAPLITNELKAINGVTGVKFSLPNLFNITYNSSASKSQIIGLEVFGTYKALEIINK